MHPSLTSSEDMERYIAAGHWSRDTLVDCYRSYAVEFPNRIAFRDSNTSYTWSELDVVTNRFAIYLATLGLKRDATALVQTASTCREIIIRVAFKKAGIIGAFAPVQWRRRELDYVYDRINPSLVVMAEATLTPEDSRWLDNVVARAPDEIHRINLSDIPSMDHLCNVHQRQSPLTPEELAIIQNRQFTYGEVSLITVSSGTSGLAKLCEWPEGAQLCASRAQQEKMQITEDDIVGVFAPMSGAAGLVVWMVSATTPCTYVFPDTYNPAELLSLVDDLKISVGTTVPVILARFVQQDLSLYKLDSLRVLRVGTAATDLAVARSFEEHTNCSVLLAAGSMEVPGFAHAHVNEPKYVRFNGSIGLPLRGADLRIEDEHGRLLEPGSYGELKVSAPYASSGYWNDREANASAWSGRWYVTGDLGMLDDDGRLTLLGRKKETINRSGMKILPTEVEQEICNHPDVLECAVIAAPDPEYGEVPWAFVQMRTGPALNNHAIVAMLRNTGLAEYKIPVRFVQLSELPRVNDNKIDKISLKEMATR